MNKQVRGTKQPFHDLSWFHFYAIQFINIQGWMAMVKRYLVVLKKVMRKDGAFPVVVAFLHIVVRSTPS